MTQKPNEDRIDQSAEFVPVRIAVLTLSDSRTLAEDRSGDVLVGRIAEAGHILADRDLLKDDLDAVATRLQGWVDNPEVDVVISTGGTGLTGRDITVEAHQRVYEKEIEGFAALFHMISARKIGTSTMQSRACAGVAHGTYLFALPGSPGACKDGWDEILKWQLDIRHRPCNLVEIMPRLEEHRRAAS
ncbi:MAG: molybdenum cofactor biosynthesis protein B [Pseudomonadota bacterium]